MPSLSSGLFNEVVALLEPKMTTLDNRQDQLGPLLQHKSVYSKIVWEGNRYAFTRKLVGLLSFSELLEVVRSLNLGAEQRANIDRVCARIEQEMSGGAESSGTFPEDGLRVVPLDELITHYRKHLIDKIERVRQPGKNESVPLENVFVALTITDREVRPFLSREIARDRRSRPLLAFPPREGVRGPPFAELDRGRNFASSIRSISHLHRAAIVGAQGSGKTTLLHYLAWRTLKEGRRFPVLLELKTLRADDLNLANGDLGKLLFNKAVASPNLSPPERESLLEYFHARLRTGQTTVLLDGLDEVKGRSFFNDLCTSVDEFCSRAGENQIVVSARPYALETRFAALEEVEIAPLSTVQIELFIEHYYGRGEKTRKLVAQLFRRPELRELARVPYFLAVMAYVSNRGDSLEGNRLTLYRMLTQNLIVCLDNEKRVSRFRLPDANGALKRDFLCHLAYMGLVARDPEDYADWLVLSDEQVVEEAKRFCFEQQLPATWARELAEDVRATPLLREVGEGAWVFTQRILQEFLAAAALVKRNDYKSEFCLAYFDPVLAETEVLPMSVALAEQRLGPMLTFIEKLPESLTLINFRSRARAMGYGVKPDHEALKRLTNQLVEFVSRCRVEHSSFLKATFNAFSGFSEEERDYVTASILPLLADVDKGTQANAAKLLGFLKGAGAESALCKMLQAGDAELIWPVAEALSRIAGEETLQCMLTALRNTNESLRHSAAITLGLVGSDRATDALTMALEDSSLLVRWACVDALGQIGGRRAMRGLLKALSDKHPNVRESAARVLGCSGLDELEDTLVARASRRNDDSVHGREREATIDALGWMGSVRAVPSILEALTHQEFRSRGCAARALGRIGGEQAAVGLIDALRDKDLHLGIAAAEELANVAGRKALAALLDALKDQQLVAHVRAAAARALGKIGGEEALSALLSALDDESEIPRWSAAEALGRIGGEQAITGLAKALQDHDITVRWRAVQALGKIGGDRPVTLLLNLLEDKRETSPFVLSEIAKVLGELGDRRAMPVLADVLGDDRGLGESGEWFRKRARAALEQLAGRPAMANALSGIEDKNFNRMRESWANILANESGGGKFGVLLSMAGSTDPRMQISFWEVLLRMDVPQVASGLVQALHEDDDAVRRKAAEVIGYYRRDESTCRELSRLGSHDPIDSVKVAARTALEQINFARQWLVQRMV